MDFNNTSHRRKNILTGEWVLVSPHRTKRPWQGKKDKPQEVELLDYDPTAIYARAMSAQEAQKPRLYRHIQLP